MRAEKKRCVYVQRDNGIASLSDKKRNNTQKFKNTLTHDLHVGAMSKAMTQTRTGVLILLTSPGVIKGRANDVKT